jgi:enoyl-CoA hydratase/carnithine racemase
MESLSAFSSRVLIALRCELRDGVAVVSLAAPKANALSLAAFAQLRELFAYLGGHPDVRCVVLRGEGRHFCSGIDTSTFGQLLDGPQCAGRRNTQLHSSIRGLQDALTSLEKCRAPVLAAIHGACLGGALDLICCADARFAAADASFCILEGELGFAADLGTLARLPRLVGDARARDWALTCRSFTADEALASGLVSAIYATREDLDAAVMRVAAGIAARSPIAMSATKGELLYARDHSVNDALEHVAWRNAATLASDDLKLAMAARARGGPPAVFSRL